MSSQYNVQYIHLHCQYFNMFCSTVILASTVLEHFQLQPLVKISLFILNLPLHRTCQEAIASEQCVLNRSVSSSRNSCGDNTARFFYCCCYGENCTEHLLYTYHCTNTISNVCTRVCCYHGNSIFFNNPTNITSKLQTLE